MHPTGASPGGAGAAAIPPKGDGGGPGPASGAGGRVRRQQADRGEAAAPVSRFWPWLLGLATFCWSSVIVLAQAAEHFPHRLLVVFGVVAAWRYGWAMVHLTRALAYLGIAFPRLRAKAARTNIAGIGHVYGVVSSYGIPERQFRAVYGALIANCLATGLPATLVAAITTDRDCAILGDLLDRFGHPDGIEIIAQFQEGVGKRAAMAMALRTIARLPAVAGSATLFLDGDVVLAPGALSESLRFLAADPSLAALTTNNDAELPAGDPARHWYRLRFAQRHLLMCSLALSRRLLVLTGRFSLYRTRQAIAPAFIDIIENDAIDHWLHGRIRFLSGDDKSMWYQVLRSGGRMLYLPHVRAVSFESMPDGTGLLGGSTRLMLRWFGNMVRTSGRAIALGPARCGPFLWWCLVDQRISVLTTLLGVSTAAVLVLSLGPIYLVFYLAWVVMTRAVASSIYGLVWGGYHPSWPFLLAYGQIWGGLIKLHLLFRPDRQAWTRQHISRADSSRVRHWAANGLEAVAAFGLLAAAAWLVHLTAGA